MNVLGKKRIKEIRRVFTHAQKHVEGRLRCSFMEEGIGVHMGPASAGARIILRMETAKREFDTKALIYIPTQVRVTKFCYDKEFDTLRIIWF